MACFCKLKSSPGVWTGMILCEGANTLDAFSSGCHNHALRDCYRMLYLFPKNKCMKLWKSSSYQLYPLAVMDKKKDEGNAEEPKGSKRDPLAVVLDIEGTTTPISFVTETLFPYALNNVRNHLVSTFKTEETQVDIGLLRELAEQDVKVGTPGIQIIPPIYEIQDKIVSIVEANVLAMIKADRKVFALKELQGHIWRSGFRNGELQAQVFEDVPEALRRWHSSGKKVYIYSSGSREAQKLIFGNTQHGDLQPFLCGYFDTAIGNKRDARSYREIYLSLGMGDPADVIFVTDVLQEAVAAKQAGLQAVICLRPGNAPLDAAHDFPTVMSLLDI